MAVSTKDPNEILGFYTLSANSIYFEDLPADLRKKLPRYPIPVALIGRLAVDKKYHGMGLGKDLLVDALKRSVEVSKSFGVFGVIVDAKDDEARKFYEHFGFKSLVDNPKKLIFSLQSLQDEFDD